MHPSILGGISCLQFRTMITSNDIWYTLQLKPVHSYKISYSIDNSCKLWSKRKLPGDTWEPQGKAGNKKLRQWNVERKKEYPKLFILITSRLKHNSFWGMGKYRWGLATGNI